MAVVKDSKKFSRGRLDCVWVRFHCRTARNMKTKPSPLAPKMKLAPAKGRNKPEKSGPIIPETSICNPARVYAEANSSLETISAMIEEWAGEPKANPALKRNALASMR